MLWGLVSKAPREPGTKSAHNIHFLHPCLIGLVAHLRCSGVLVPKLQDEPVQVTKPAHNAQFSLFPCHWLGTHVMYSMAWCRNHKVTGCQNQLTMYIFSIPVSLASSSCQELWGPGAETCRNHKMNRKQNQLTIHNFLYSCVIGCELMSCALRAWCRNRKVNCVLYSRVIGLELMSRALGA